MRTALHNWLREPRADDPPHRVWRDWVLVAAVWIGTIIELVLRNDIAAPWAAAPLVLVLSAGLLWRRTHPLHAFMAAFGGVAVYDVAVVIFGYGPLNLYGSALLAIMLYSLFRWGSGHEMLLGTPVAVALTVIANVFDYNGISDVIGGSVVLLLIAAVALAVRFRGRSLRQGRDQIRVLEREQLARELHDTVAHHVSAIVVQAQAGRFVAEGGSLAGASDALAVIEEEAARTLTEMRAIVGILRDSDTASALAPQHGLADVAGLASSTGTPPVTVTVEATVSHVSAQVGAAVYRIAQESITNARRHSRKASTVDVRVSGDDSAIHIAVIDDGHATTAPQEQGFGLIGMNERATLLGGTLTAGFAPTGGWVVRAKLPRQTGS